MKSKKTLVAEEYDGGNEFNHLEQAIFAADELEEALESLISLNGAKFSKYGVTLKRVRTLGKELPTMLNALKKTIEGENGEEDDEFEPIGDEGEGDGKGDDDLGDDDLGDDGESISDDDGNDGEDDSVDDFPKEFDDAIGGKDEDDEDEFDDSFGMEESINAVLGIKGKKPINEEFCVKEESPASDLEDKTWQCEDFWEKLHSQNLESAMDDYFEQNYPDGMGLTEFNDLLRFEGDDLLAALGYQETNQAAGENEEVEEF